MTGSEPTTNQVRVNRAHAAMETYLARTDEPFRATDATTHLVDLLGDLRHWADAHQVNFVHAAVLSHAHWLEECHGGAGGRP